MDGPWVLALDTSTPRTVLCVGRMSQDLRRAELRATLLGDERANQASVTLVERIGAVCEMAGIRPPQLGLVACGRGPGTFTGTRVAAATAKGLALGLGCRVVPVSTLAAIAATADTGGAVLATVDARRGEVYAGLFRTDPEGVPDAMVTPIGDERCGLLHELLPSDVPVRVVGSGVDPYRAALPPAAAASAVHFPGPRPFGLWRATVAAAASDGAIDATALDAVYLRKSYAELGINRPKRPTWRSPFI